MPLHKVLWQDTVARLNKAKAVIAVPSTPIRDAVAMMRENRSGCLFVHDEGRLAGIFTERDLLKRVLGARRSMDDPISAVMTPNPATVQEGDSIASVVRKLREGGHRHLPVVDEFGRIAGRLSVREVVHYMVEQFPRAVYNLPPKPNQVERTPDGA